jgi:hypothetical protein
MRNVGHRICESRPGWLFFQAETVVTGRLVRPTEAYTQLRILGEPATAPWSAFPRGKVITFSTDKGDRGVGSCSRELDLLARGARVAPLG